MRTHRSPRPVAVVVAFTALSLFGAVAGTGCGNADEPYKATPAWSGRKAALPAPPTVPAVKLKDGDAYTVAGAVHHLRSRLHNTDVTTKNIAIVGYIVDSNIPRAPPCAVHKTGKKDPDDCVTEVPTFYIADSKTVDLKDDKVPKIKVMGWASNFANVYDAMDKYKSLKEPPTEKQVYKDAAWATDVPWPLPAVGAKVKVLGKYGVNFTKSVGADPLNGIMTYGGPPDSKIEVLEPAPEPAAFAKK